MPGQFPFTRGVYPSMYRGRLWTMRQFAGFGTAEETNERFRYLLEHGQSGLSTAFDMPSLMGHDPDHPRSLGEVGREGVAVDTVLDMEMLFAGIPLDEVSVSMTINAPAAIMLAFFVAAAERQGVPAERLGGTIQTDILKEYIAQKEWCFPVDPAGHRHGRVVHDAHAALASDQHLGVPRSRGRLDCRPGAGVHAQGRSCIGRARDRASSMRALKKKDSRGAKSPTRRRSHRYEVRRARGAPDADAFPHPDGRRVADRPAAAQTTSSATAIEALAGVAIPEVRAMCTVVGPANRSQPPSGSIVVATFCRANATAKYRAARRIWARVVLGGTQSLSHQQLCCRNG